MIENIDDKIDPVLYPILNKEINRDGNVKVSDE